MVIIIIVIQEMKCSFVPTSKGFPVCQPPSDLTDILAGVLPTPLLNLSKGYSKN